MPDLLDELLADGDADTPVSLEIQDSNVPLAPFSLGWWLRKPDAQLPLDSDALQWVREGPVLDVGCCTGRDLEILARRGVEGHGIDISPTAVALAKENGISCSLEDAFLYDPPHSFKAVLLMGGNGGMAGTLGKLPAFLDRLRTWLTHDGFIVFSASDWRLLPKLGPQQRDGDEVRSPGEVFMRNRVDERIGAWFPWHLVSPNELADACGKAGLLMGETTYWSKRPVYSTILRQAATGRTG
nr:class I SAM-dependent methyltransferase [Streptomyces sp. NBC_00857]